MDFMKWSRNAALLMLPLMLTACASSSEHNALQAQVNQMTRQMSSSQTNQADSWSQIVELRQEVADLKGQIDTLNHAPLYPSKLRRLIMNLYAGAQTPIYLENECVGDPEVTD